MKILVIEDEPSFRDLTVEVLRDDGYVVESAPDGTSGLAAAFREPPDLVVCDLRMHGIDGYEVLAALRRDPRTAVVPVIFLTGVGGDVAVRRGMGLGADDYLVKPVTVEVLLTAVRARLERSHAVRRDAERRLNDLRVELARSLLPHELLTPLTAVMGLASLLQEEGAIDAAQVKEVADGILRGAKELETTITKFLLCAEVHAGTVGPAAEPKQAATALAETARLLAARAGRSSDVVVDVQPFGGPMSAEHLQAMANELLQNALECSPPGSRVTLRCRPAPEGWVMSVEDQGRGMTGEHVAGLSRPPFLRRNASQPGLGLGLTIVRKLVELYDCQLSFDTVSGRGTTVSVCFPALVRA